MLFLLLGLALLIVALMIAIYPFYFTGAPREATIRIPANATEQNVADTLKKYFGDSFAGNVMKAIRLRDTDFSTRHGAYKIEKGTCAFNTMRRLTSGAQTPVKITINGFRNYDEMLGKIAAKMDFSAEELRKAVEDPAFLADYGLTPASAMALFVNDTYEVYWSDSPRHLAEKIGANYKSVWNDANRKTAADLGLTPADITIIASIVDEETNAASEKGTVGRLYINRLQKGMRLQADPTVRFALGDFLIKRVSRNDLRTESPYNTYLHAGLPPGPIRTTGKATITAILQSSPHDYLYMCAKDDFSGTHNFSTTFDEHRRNADRYQAALDARGIAR